MLWIVYNVLFAVGYTLLLPRFFFRMWRRGGYRRDFGERLGIVSNQKRARLAERPRAWIHAVSVGEVFVALRYMEAWRRERPSTAFVLSTTTSTGHRVAEKATHGSDVLLYAPCDFPFAVRRMLGLVRPVALLLTECELWPNLIRHAHDSGVPVMLINGRLSDSSFRGYRKLRVFFRHVLRRLDAVLVQTEEDRRRVIELGAEASRVKALGSAKYDALRPDEAAGRAIRAWFERIGWDQDDRLLVGGSTWPGEESALLDIFLDLKPRVPCLRLVLVPRHAERRHEVEMELRERGVRYALRSMSTDAGLKDGVPDAVLVDTTGELFGVYACADLVFVGKSLTRHGGQNIIEPALLGKPVLTGPHLENFPVVAQDFLDASALVRVRNPEELGVRIEALLLDTGAREALGRAAADVVKRKQGVVSRSLDYIFRCLDARCSGGVGSR